MWHVDAYDKLKPYEVLVAILMSKTIIIISIMHKFSTNLIARDNIIIIILSLAMYLIIIYSYSQRLFG